MEIGEHSKRVMCAVASVPNLQRVDLPMMLQLEARLSWIISKHTAL